MRTLLVRGLGAASLLGTMAFAEVRPIDGLGNNVSNPKWGSANDQLQRFGGVHYGDGMASMAGADRPSPRKISNLVSAQAVLTESRNGLSDMTWCWGQFLDHDLTLVLPSHDEFIPVMVEEGDSMSPMIPVMRSSADPDTGTDTSNPRQQVNTTTAFIDGSMVYGNSDERAAALRSFIGGRLKMSDQGLLPLNDLEIEMENPNNAPTKSLYMAGDVRANENPALISMHTLWVREHNRWADTLAKLQPDWSDEELYQHARRHVIGQIQNITFEEFLPALLGPFAPSLDEAHYDEAMHPGMFNEISGALYRIGHTMVSAHIIQMNDNGSVPMLGRFLFKDAFFQPSTVSETEMVGHVLRGVAGKPMQEIDPFVVADLRNFLFAQEGTGGMDLIAINLQRGRDHGLPSFNQAREALGLAPHESFSSISSNLDIVGSLEEAYGDVGQIDLWIGAMAEDHMEGASVGETIATALAMQFSHLRDGDRFFYLVDEALTSEEKEAIRNTTLADVIRRNTNLLGLQDAVFMAPPKEQWMDSDHDGQADIREVIAGTDPLSSSSGLRAFVSRSGSSLNLQWSSVPKKRYVIESAATLDGPWTALRTVDALEDEEMTAAEVVPSEAQGFYRVVVSE